MLPTIKWIKIYSIYTTTITYIFLQSIIVTFSVRFINVSNFPYLLFYLKKFAFHCEWVYNIRSITFNYGSINSPQCLRRKAFLFVKTLLSALRARFIKSTLQLNVQAMVPIIGQILHSNKKWSICLVMCHEGCTAHTFLEDWEHENVNLCICLNNSGQRDIAIGMYWYLYSWSAEEN